MKVRLDHHPNYLGQKNHVPNHQIEIVDLPIENGGSFHGFLYAFLGY